LTGINDNDKSIALVLLHVAGAVGRLMMDGAVREQGSKIFDNSSSPVRFGIT
jgi:hypothetical protein